MAIAYHHKMPDNIKYYFSLEQLYYNITIVIISIIVNNNKVEGHSTSPLQNISIKSL